MLPTPEGSQRPSDTTNLQRKFDVLNSFCASDNKYSSHVIQVEKAKSRDWKDEDPKPVVG